MNTDRLIDQLMGDLRPVPAASPRAALGKGLLAGAIVAAAAILLLPPLGLRHDLGVAMLTGIFWVKLLYTGSIAAFGFRALARLSRPGNAPPHWRGIVLPPLLALALFTLVALANTDATPAAFWMGSTWRQCTFYCAALSLPMFAGLLSAVSRLAPTQLTAAGAAAGLVAGGASATLYAFHCAEASPGFVLLWYSLGLGIAPVAGAAIGSRLLRW